MNLRWQRRWIYLVDCVRGKSTRHCGDFPEQAKTLLVLFTIETGDTGYDSLIRGKKILWSIEASLMAAGRFDIRIGK